MFATVWGELMSAKNRWSSSHTRVVPFGDRFGDPSSHTVAWKPSPCSRTMRFMSSVRIATVTFALRFPHKRPAKGPAGEVRVSTSTRRA